MPGDILPPDRLPRSLPMPPPVRQIEDAARSPQPRQNAKRLFRKPHRPQSHLLAAAFRDDRRRVALQIDPSPSYRLQRIEAAAGIERECKRQRNMLRQQFHDAPRFIRRQVDLANVAHLLHHLSPAYHPDRLFPHLGRVIHRSPEPLQTAIDFHRTVPRPFRILNASANVLVADVANDPRATEQIQDRLDLPRYVLAGAEFMPDIIDPAREHILDGEDLDPAPGEFLFLDLPRYLTSDSFGFPFVSSASASEIGRAALFLSKPDLRAVDPGELSVLAFPLEDADAGHVCWSLIHWRTVSGSYRLQRPL